jgi:hypothetical protein
MGIFCEHFPFNFERSKVMNYRKIIFSLLAMSLLTSFLFVGCVTVKPTPTSEVPAPPSQEPVSAPTIEGTEIKVATSIPETNQTLLTEDAILNMQY